MIELTLRYTVILNSKYIRLRKEVTVSNTDWIPYKYNVVHTKSKLVVLRISCKFSVNNLNAPEAKAVFCFSKILVFKCSINTPDEDQSSA